jgi:hypothetical protein
MKILASVQVNCREKHNAKYYTFAMLNLANSVEETGVAKIHSAILT